VAYVVLSVWLGCLLQVPLDRLTISYFTDCKWIVMESKSVGGSQDHDEICASSSDDLLLAEANPGEVGKDGGLSPVVGEVRQPRPGSLTLMENLEKNRRESARSQLKGLTLKDISADRPRVVSTVRQLPKALQPKESRCGSKPLVPSPTSVYSGTAGKQLSSGVNVFDSVLRQQRLSSASESPTSPTAKPSHTATLHLSAKPEVIFQPPETEKTGSVGRCDVSEPKVGLVKLRAVERQSYRPEVDTLSTSSHYRSTQFSDLLSFFQSPSSTTSSPRPANYTLTPSKYSKLNKFTFDVDEPPSIVTAEPTVNSVSASNAVFDPSPTISKLIRKQQTGAVHAGRRQLETQASCPEMPVSPKSVKLIENRKSVTSPITTEENSDGVSTSTASDPIALSPSSYTSNPSDVEQDRATSVDWLNVSANSDVNAAMTEETVNKVADDDDDDDDDVKAQLLTSNITLNSDIKVASSSLPSVPPPTVCLPLDLAEDSSRDEDRYKKAVLSEGNRAMSQLLLPRPR